MLYDKRWEKKVAGEEDVSPEIFSLDGLIAWLETKNPDTRYCYRDQGRCLAAQFNTYCGKKYVVTPCIDTYIALDGGKFVPFSDAVLEWIAVSDKHTYGAALSRARKIAEAR